jgi:hypothetical protein
VIGINHLPKLRESKPKSEEELEGIVEGEPVDSVDSALKDPASQIRFSMR